MLPYFLQASRHQGDVKLSGTPILPLCDIRNQVLDEYAVRMTMSDYFNDQRTLFPLVLPLVTWCRSLTQRTCSSALPETLDITKRGKRQWHAVFGWLVGLFVCLFVFTGMLIMNSGFRCCSQTEEWLIGCCYVQSETREISSFTVSISTAARYWVSVCN